MTLIRLENVSLAFGEAALLDRVNLQIEARERIFLIGRNGMGKSCLLKLIMGEYTPDDGKIHRSPNLKVAGLSQNLLVRGNATIYDVVAEGLEEMGSLLKEYHQLVQTLEPHSLKLLEEVQRKIEAKQGWQYEQKIETILTQLELPANQSMDSLSGGWQRRVDLARALISEPDLLLLDEPTNHLDLKAIEWLESYLENYPGAVLCVTHDRTLLRKLSKRILELDRGKLISWEGNYDKFLEDKAHRLEVEATQAKKFDTVLAQEEAWIRQGIKARRTRNEGRVRALKKLRQERQLRREVQNKPTFALNESIVSGELVIEAEHIFYGLKNETQSEQKSELPPQKQLVKDFSIRILRGDKIALVGPNGVGKTTLLKLLLGELSPDQGTIKQGTQLHIGYFDQLRAGIDFNLSAVENVASGREFITINGKSKHIISYLSDFLFTPERSRTPVSALSGGECNRLLLAKLFSLPNNVLVLDEPTNDLDIESLELLEALLVDYSGTLLVVSHDRSFVDEVATSTLLFTGQGKIMEFVGGYSDIPFSTVTSVMPAKISIQNTNPPIQKTAQKPIPSKLKRELDALPGKIATLEQEQLKLHTELAQPELYNHKTQIIELTERLKGIEHELHQLYQRWEELESLIKM